MLAAGCSSSGTVSSQPGSSGGQGTPQRGGTLAMLGQSDIFNLDTVSAYYTVSSMLERMFTRQLFSYGDPTGAATPPPVVPDVATTIPTTSNGGITDGGKTITIHLRTGVKWDTIAGASGDRGGLRPRVQDAVQPGFAGRCARLLHRHDRREWQSYCAGFAKVPGTVGGIAAYVNSHSPAGRGRDQRRRPSRSTCSAPRPTSCTS